MTKLRLIKIATVLPLLTWFVAMAVPVSAMPAPRDSADDTAGNVAAVPPQPTVIHQHTPTWTYVVIAVAAIGVTLAVVFLIARLRRPSSVSQPNPSPTAA